MSAAILSCSDGATAPSSALSPRGPALDGIKVVALQVPASLKNPGLRAAGNKAPGAPKFDLTDSPEAPKAPSAYTVSKIPFVPKPSPSNVLISTLPSDASIECGDCVAFHVPIGFDFTFYGNTYSELSVSSNGLVGFASALGSESSPMDGCCSGWGMPSADPTAMYNNIIALAWTDWTPSASAPVTFETEGTAPNRMFVLQWNNVPEYIPGAGHVTAQLVLFEGSNDIAMYTTSMNVTDPWHPVTQGIQNADGSDAAWLPYRPADPNVPDDQGDPERIQNQFSLSSDAILFRINRNPITIVAPPDIEIGTNAGVCYATVALTQPTVSGGGEGLVVAGQRNDRLALNGEYPKGVTTITWTATDAAGTTQFATQTVSVADREAPVLSLPANVVVGNDPGLATAVVNVGVAEAQDNCARFSISEPANGVYPVGVTPVVWTATDEAGNIGHATQLVTVKDVEAPTIDLPPSITVNATSPTGALVSFAGFGHDNVGVTSFDCNRVSGTLFRIGQTLVSCSAVDAAGNKSAPASLSVTVIGAAQQIVNLVTFMKAFLPAEREGCEEHRGNDGHSNGGHWNDDRGNNDGRGNDDERCNNQSSWLGGNLILAALSALSDTRNSRGGCAALDVLAAFTLAKTPAMFPATASAQILGDIARIKNVLGCRPERRGPKH